MKRVMFAMLVSAVAMSAMAAEPDALLHAQSPTIQRAENALPKMAIVVTVHKRDSRGAMSLVGEQMTRGEPLKFNQTFSYLDNTPNGHLSMTISNFQEAFANTVAFDASMEGKDPGIWEGQATSHVLTGTGSLTGVLHWLDGNDYVVTLRRVAG